MSTARVLIAGIGNIFLGDDGFGPAVIEKLGPIAGQVRVVDFGVRARELALALSDCDAAILIDATARGEPPGTLYVLEPHLRHADPALPDGHSLTAEQILLSLPERAQPWLIRIVGCEPQTLEPDPCDMGLSPVVSAAVEAAVPLIERVLAELLAELAGGSRASTEAETGAIAHA